MPQPHSQPHYYIIGGVFTDSQHITLVEGTVPYRVGPFLSVETARMALKAKYADHTQDAYAHFYIEREDESFEFWVIGGKYTDTSFTTIAEEHTEERLGPFRDYEQAVTVWRDKAMSSVDDACVRYRLDKL